MTHGCAGHRCYAPEKSDQAKAIHGCGDTLGRVYQTEGIDHGEGTALPGRPNQPEAPSPADSPKESAAKSCRTRRRQRGTELMGRVSHDGSAVKAEERTCACEVNKGNGGSPEHVSSSIVRVIGAMGMPPDERAAYWRALDDERERRLREAIADGRVTEDMVRRVY